MPVNPSEWLGRSLRDCQKYIDRWHDEDLARDYGGLLGLVEQVGGALRGILHAQSLALNAEDWLQPETEVAEAAIADYERGPQP